MKRLYMCIGIFLLIILSSWASLNELKRSTRQLEEKAFACIEAYEQNSSDTEQKISELKRYWKRYYRKVSFITRSSSLEELAVSVSRLDDLTDNTGGDLCSELKAIIYRANVIYDSQRPVAYSVF